MNTRSNITIFSKDNGRILINRSGPVEDLQYISDPYVEGTFLHETHYIDDAESDNPTPKLRQQQQTRQDASSVVAGSSITLSSLPEPCTVRIAGQTYSVPDGVLEWATAQPGTYPISVTAFPYLDWQGEVEVTEVLP